MRKSRKLSITTLSVFALCACLAMLGLDVTKPILNTSWQRMNYVVSNELPPMGELPSDNPLVPILENLSDYTTHESSPLLWSMPPNTAGATQIKSILSSCLHRTVNELFKIEGRPYMFLGDSKDEDDILVLSNLQTVPVSFGPDLVHQKAKLFSIFLHPNLRSTYLFEELKSNELDPHYDERVADMQLLDYLKFLQQENNQNHYHQYRIGNWITRSLVQKGRLETLTDEDVVTATNILRTKAVVGLFNELEDSFVNFSRYFGWEGFDINICQTDMLKVGGVSSLMIAPTEWSILSSLNDLDIKLYKNIKLIFQEQKSKISEMDEDFIKNFSSVKNDEYEIKGVSVFFKPPPSSAGGFVVERVLDSCFDLSRGEVFSNAGDIDFKYLSVEQREMEETDSKALSSQVFVVSNLHALNMEKLPADTANMFTFIAHPVRRAAHMIRYLQKATHDPNYDYRVKDMTLSDYLSFILQDGNENHYHRYRISNWMTRALSQSTRNKILNDEDTAIAIKTLEEKFIVGFFDYFEESLEKLKMAFEWEADVAECLAEPDIPVSTVDGSGITEEEWKLLASLNHKDLQIYNTLKEKFQVTD